MNAELYILRNMDKSGKTTATLNTVAEKLRQSGIRVAYKTELDEKREKIIYSIADSLKPEENINVIFVPNAFESDAEDTVMFKTLSSLTSKGGTADKKRLEDALCGFTGDFQSATPINSDGDKNGYLFVVNGMKVVLLPAVEKSKIGSLIEEATKAVKKLGAVVNSEVNNAVADNDIIDNEDDVVDSILQEVNVAEKELADEELQEESNGVNFVNNSFKIEEPAPKPIDTSTIREIDDDPDTVTLISGSGVTSEKKSKKQSKEKSKEKGKKKGPTFKERFIPLKEDSGKEKARKIILDIAIIVFVITAIILIKVAVVDPFLNNKKYDEIKDYVKSNIEIATEITTDAEGNEVINKITTEVDWDKLKGINDEVIAWVSIDDTNIDYPVLQHKEDTIDYQYYLYKDIYKNYSGYGSVFADFRSNKGIHSKNIILHGHHMKDGSMFENLMGYGKYTADMDFYKEHPTIDFDTPEGISTYKIISVFKTSTLDAHGEFFDYLTGSFESDAEFMNYVYLVRERSLIDTGVTCNEDDQLLTLSTCSYEYSEFRTVVVARKTRTGESSKVDVSKAKANPNPLWPDVYYGYDASAKPKVTTFKTEYKKNKENVSWYDGKGNLKGKERMFTLHDGEEVDEDATADATENTTQATTPEATTPVVVNPESIMLDYSQLVMNVGDTETLKVLWTPSNTTEKGITWTSSNANVAKVASGGKVKAIAPGECTVTAETTNGHKYSATVIVNDILATKLTLSSSAYNTTKIGETYSLYATYQPSNASHKVTWATSNEAVATVSSAGIVKIKGYGTCTITATIDSLTCKCAITVTQPATNPPATTPPATNPPATTPPVEDDTPQATEDANTEE